jgi:hypothetical protein
MELCHSWEVPSCQATQDITSMSRNPKVWLPCPQELATGTYPQPYEYIHFNIILSPTSRSRLWPLSLWLYHLNHGEMIIFAFCDIFLALYLLLAPKYFTKDFNALLIPSAIFGAPSVRVMGKRSRVWYRRRTRWSCINKPKSLRYSYILSYILTTAQCRQL